MVFDIEGEKWTLDLRPGSRKVSKGAPEGKPDLTLTITDENFVKLVMGKMGPQQVRRPCSPDQSHHHAPAHDYVTAIFMTHRHPSLYVQKIKADG